MNTQQIVKVRKLCDAGLSACDISDFTGWDVDDIQEEIETYIGSMEDDYTAEYDGFDEYKLMAEG